VPALGLAVLVAVLLLPAGSNQTTIAAATIVTMLPNGDIAINDDYHDRVVIVDPRRNAIVWQYGHIGRPGTGFDSLKTPDGMDFVPLSRGGTPLWGRVHHP